jgi:hypothetical protein
MFLRPYSLLDIFTGQQTGGLDRLEAFVRLSGQRAAKSIYQAFELKPEFSRFRACD